MNIVSTTKISKVASNDVSRPAIQQVKVIPNGSDGSIYLTATNGHALAVCKEFGEVPKEGVLVPSDLIGNQARDSVLTSEDGMRWENITTSKVGDSVDTLYPDIAQVISDNEEIETVISLNPEILYNLALALHKRGKKGDLQVSVIIPKNHEKPMYVIPIWDTAPGEFGLVMPVRNPDQDVVTKFKECVAKFKAALHKSIS